MQRDATEGASPSTGRVLLKGPSNQPEVRVWLCTPGRSRLPKALNDRYHLAARRVVYRCDDDEAF